MDDEIQVPITEFVRAVAHEAATAALEEHAERCSIRRVELRVQNLEISRAKAVGFVTAASMLGGLIGGAVASLFS